MYLHGYGAGVAFGLRVTRFLFGFGNGSFKEFLNLDFKQLDGPGVEVRCFHGYYFRVGCRYLVKRCIRRAECVNSVELLWDGAEGVLGLGVCGESVALGYDLLCGCEYAYS